MSRAVLIIGVLDIGAMMASLPYSLHMTHRGATPGEEVRQGVSSDVSASFPRCAGRTGEARIVRFTECSCS